MAVASEAREPGAEGPSLGPSGTLPHARAHRLRTCQSEAPHLVLVSDAGPWGDWRCRHRTGTGDAGRGVAPAVRPKKAGARGTTARREAGHLSRLLRAGALPPVYVPTVEAAARRALRRVREEALQALTAAKCRRIALWRRHEIRSTGRAPWRPAP
jgi:hypothetical protein